MITLKKPLILGSSSPRRKEILSQAGFDFTIEKTGTNENYPEYFKTHEVALHLSEKKARALKDKGEECLIITADTIVSLEDQILNKPAQAKDAKAHLNKLSGQKHEVITGVTLITEAGEESFYDITSVQFKNLAEKEIDYYINHYHPYDKAGSYAIQEWIGLIGIESIKGSYFNVMGLPIHKVYEKLSPWFE